MNNPTSRKKEGRSNNNSSVIPYPGGKGREVGWILEKMPPHKTFVDVFGGSGAIIYNKPTSDYEIYNDANEDLVQFFEVLRTREDDLYEYVKNVPYARKIHEEWAKEFFNGERPDDPIKQAGRFFTLRYMQFSSDIAVANGFKTRASRSPAQTFDNARERIDELADRFRDVIIECRDYKKILQGYDDDTVDVLFYLDPPYVDGKDYYPIEFDHSEFAKALLEVENDWMVSYSKIPNCLIAAMIGAVREQDQEFYVLNRNRRHRMDRKNTNSEEHLICNFDPSERASFIDQDVSQQTLDIIQ